MLRACPHCGDLVSVEARHCACGFPLPADGPVVRGAKAAREVTEGTGPHEQGKRTRGKARKPGRLARTLQSVRNATRTRSETQELLMPRSGRSTPDSSTNPPLPPARGYDGTREPLTNPPRPPRGKGGKLIECASCGAKMSKRASVCPRCGSSPWDRCQICSAKIQPGTSSCPECGDPDPFNP